ncbi:hypothetical protein [Leptolyngbya sp. 7M]|uniref:hypothetical protein n=1 Tax=Leptolyngbya sp. 7M TaxID=2812896 RepID=UPI001B8B6E40|nr:hypothetical protein [Leptolyngbya sp. 7M]QYO68122.1 hypothetical protein JVX88_15920 [Leptolyngbya sp. 7M]
MKKSKVLVFSIALIGYDQIFQHCIDSHRAYCRKYGYDYVLIDKFPGIPDKEEATWLKIVLMIEALKSSYDWVFFVDSDCEIRNHTPRLEEIQVINKYIYLAPGHSGYINAGILIAKSSSEAIHYFEKVLDSAQQEIPELSIVDWGDNPYIIHHAKENPDIYLLTHDWNNNTNLDSQSYIFHYSSGTFRAFYLEKYASRISQTKGKILRKIYNTYLRNFPKRNTFRSRMDDYRDFYTSRYAAFQKQTSTAGVSVS